MTEEMTVKTITVRGQSVTLYHYELFLLLYKEWRASGMSQEDVEDLLLAS